MKKFAYTLLFVFSLIPLVTSAQVNVTVRNIVADVEMVWEAHSYTPPFYKGKALYSIGGEVAVVALPPAYLGNPSTLSYVWKKDAEVQGAFSGVGKNSFTFSGSQFGESPLITVEVSNGNTSSYGSLRLQQTAPVVRFYENRPLEGVSLDHALPRSFSTREKEVVVEAYPYFFSASGRADSTLSYTWTANGQKLTDARGASISIQSTEPRSVIVGLSISHLKEILQSAEDSLTVVFE